MTDALKRYDLFGWDYARYSPLGEAEVAWYVKHAGETGGPVLGLACGTARLLCRVAEAGLSAEASAKAEFEATGLDLSATMLAIARANVAALDAGARVRVTLVRGDMSAFDLGCAFGQIHLADNSFRELATREAMRACLRAVRAHLAPGGRFLMAERRFNPALYPNGRREFGGSEPLTNPVTGETVRRRGVVVLAPDRRSLRGEFLYEVTRPEGSVAVERCPFDSLILRTDDYLALFADAGFESEAFADYTDRPADGAETITCFVCAAAQGGGHS